jgi:hypothetical protein
MMTEDMANAELLKLEAEIASRQKKIEQYEQNEVPPVLRNYRYVVDFIFPATGDPGAQYGPGGNQFNRFPMATQAFLVRKDTVFVVKGVEAVYSAVGTITGTAQAATITVPETVRNAIFDYRFKVYDSGSGREWQNDWVPSELLFGGNRRGLQFGNGHALLSGGSEVIVSVDAGIGSLGVVSFAGLTNGSITSNLLKFSFYGVEVKL